MVKLHDGSVMILGGYPVIYETKSLIFNPIDGSFSAGPELTYGRIYPGIALINRSIFTNTRIYGHLGRVPDLFRVTNI